MFNTEISELLKKERLKQNLTQDKLAKLAGVTERTIRYWETGKKKMTLESADKVFKALGVTITIGKEDKQ